MRAQQREQVHVQQGGRPFVTLYHRLCDTLQHVSKLQVCNRTPCHSTWCQLPAWQHAIDLHAAPPGAMLNKSKCR